jgi:hypothetical protein
MSRLGGVALTSPSLHTERISEYKLNYLPFHLQVVYYNCVKFKLYTVLIHCLQICMKEYGCCPKFGRGDNLTYTLKYVLYGEMGL